VRAASGIRVVYYIIHYEPREITASRPLTGDRRVFGSPLAAGSGFLGVRLRRTDTKNLEDIAKAAL